MANTSQAKKTNWVMIILLVVLVPVLLLGYKYFSKQIDENNHAAQSNEINSATQNNAVNSTPQSRDGNGAPAQNSGFPLVGDWYYKDNGAGPKYVNDKYSFTAPQMVNGELKGQLTMVMEWMGSVKSMNYEMINDGELRITTPDNAQSPYEMEYTYNAASQTLEIAEQGYHLTYTRNAPAANSHTNNNGGSSNNSGHTSNSYSTNTGSLKTAAEKMADIQWKMTATENGQTFHYTRKFSKPRVENGQVVGEYVRTYKQAGNYCTLETNYKYKMVSEELLDEYIPSVAGSDINDDPLNPISRFAQEEIATHGDETAIHWIHRSERYGEKLATPDVSVADLIGDVDPIKAANLKLSFADDRVIHYGIIPRSNRGIFVINELPDLQARIQVALFNILEEGDVQIRGFKLRLPLDILFVFTANPEDYTNRGSIVTPLKDRIESQILTHYPRSLENALEITEQEAEVSNEQKAKVKVSDLIKRLIEQVAFEARSSEFVDKKSGVSARLTISAFENAVSAAERRAIINNEKQTQVWISDLAGIIPSIPGKVELVYEG